MFHMWCIEIRTTRCLQEESKKVQKVITESEIKKARKRKFKTRNLMKPCHPLLIKNIYIMGIFSYKRG